ncbi:MAG: FAD:protein FMN transferase [Deltaproteobacteria bacterium]|nr:FAD:protein FMN transferase [Deltaproteobacteria bacterium]
MPLWCLLIGLLLQPHRSLAEGPAGGRDVFNPDQVRNFAHSETLPGAITAQANVITYHKFAGETAAVFQWAFGEMRRVALAFDPANPAGDLTRVNAEAGAKPVAVGKEMIQLLGLAKQARGWTGGAFDVVETAGASAADIRIDKAARTVRFAKPGMRIRMDHLVEGYLTDLLLLHLWNANLDNILVQVGGAARSVGHDLTGPWRLTIADFTGSYAARGITLSFSNLSAATVGAGKRAPPIDFRTKSGYASAARGATVLAADAATSLAIAHAVYLLGPEAGLKLAAKLKARAVIIPKDGPLLKSPGL